MESISHKMGKFAKGAIAGGAVIVTMAGCKIHPDAVDNTPKINSIKPMETTEIKAENKEALSTIENLPETSVKKLLQHRVSPFLSRIYPSTLDIPNVDIQTSDLVIKFETSDEIKGTGMRGLFSMEPSYAQTALGVANKNIDTYVPYIGLGELNNSYKKLADGTPLIPVKVNKGDKICNGILPKIEIATSSAAKSGGKIEQQINSLKSFLLTKELTQFALNQVMLKMVAEKMQQSGFPTSVEVKKNDKNGTLDEMEIITGVMKNLTSRNGRYLAAMDAAATVVVIKGYNPEDLRERVKNDPSLSKIVQALENVDLGKSEEEILLNALNWVLTDPLGPTVFHFGNLNDLP